MVDAGTAILCEYFKKEPEDISIEEAIDFAKQVQPYYKSLTLRSVFFNNLHLSSKKNWYDEIIEPLKESNNLVEKTCMHCGSVGCVDFVSVKGRRGIKGSEQTFAAGDSNFYKNGVEGYDLCPYCFLSVQFMPLFLFKPGSYKEGKPNDHYFLLTSYKTSTLKKWAEYCVKKYNEGVATNKHSYNISKRSDVLAASFEMQQILDNYDDYYKILHFNDLRNLNIYSEIVFDVKMLKFLYNCKVYNKTFIDILFSEDYIMKKFIERQEIIHYLVGKDGGKNYVDNKILKLYMNYMGIEKKDQELYKRIGEYLYNSYCDNEKSYKEFKAIDSKRDWIIWITRHISGGNITNAEESLSLSKSKHSVIKNYIYFYFNELNNNNNNN